MITVKTRNGAVYEIDRNRATWARIDDGHPDGGVLSYAEMELGKRLIILGPPTGPEPAAPARIILTTEVTEIKETQ